MISVEQIRVLEERIEKAIAYIGSQRDENSALSSRLSESAEALGRAEARAEQAEERAAQAELRCHDLEEAAAAFRRDQLRIEEGIIHALEKLDAFEDLVLRGDVPRGEAVKPAAAKSGPSAAKQEVPASKEERREPVRKAPLVESLAESETASVVAFDGFSSGDEASVAEATADSAGSSLAESLLGEDSDAPVATAEKAVDELDIF
jgi:chromosome segregation ATPase